MTALYISRWLKYDYGHHQIIRYNYWHGGEFASAPLVKLIYFNQSSKVAMKGRSKGILSLMNVFIEGKFDGVFFFADDKSSKSSFAVKTQKSLINFSSADDREPLAWKSRSIFGGAK
jgi:hypothetical protein